MTARKFSIRSMTRAAVMITVGAVAFTAVPGANASVDAPDIDTWSTWDGSSTLQPFGHPDTSSYGQVITVPGGQKKVKFFTYHMAAAGVTGTLTMRGEIYRWDGSKATREVAETKKKTLDVTAGDPTYKPVKFRFKGAKVKPGKQYVLFATISKDYEETDPNVATIWPVHTTDVLPGGNTVWINDAGDESLWTTTPWSGIAEYDMAIIVNLR